MTDKTIIDGIDVSGCVAFKYDGIKKPLCRAGGMTSVYKSCLCADNSNCYYKQHKRKEQECEELKSEIKHYKQIAQYHGNLSVKYTNKSAKYKQAFAEIKEIAEKKYLGCTNFCDDDNIRFCVIKQILQKISEVKQ